MLFANAIESSTGIVGYLALFGAVGFAFVFANLLLGRFLRPSNPHEEKLEIYECGEPAIGSSFVQFDLRFYVVALVFIIFDVEVAFLFPWATVFGKATALAKADTMLVRSADGAMELSPAVSSTLQEMGVQNAVLPAADSAMAAEQLVRDGIVSFSQLATLEVLVFFSILLVGFAYVWRMGALDWIRATAGQQRKVVLGRDAPSRSSPQESVLSA